MTVAKLVEYRQLFANALPPSRLGKEHASLSEFRRATNNFAAASSKEYSLVIVTESSRQRILLGMKHRGFGKGMYNSFGGKVEPLENDVQSARRELQEETGICVPIDHMSDSKVGVMRFTFEDNPVEMVVHVFRVDVRTTASGDADPRNSNEKSSSAAAAISLDPSSIRGCDEITPRWFESYYEIPLDNMFADDSVWLTVVLSHDARVATTVDGWFHFQAGGQDSNTILHHHVHVGWKSGQNDHTVATPSASRQEPSFSLEQRLFHAIHDSKIRQPTIKEFNEAFAFLNPVRKFFRKDSIDIVIDVAGGHGALAALFLASTTVNSAVVVDPADVGSGGVQRAWGPLFFPNKRLEYRYECLRTGLPVELARALEVTAPERILVVALHACHHLSDEILEISCRNGVHAAVMPCCQKDFSPGSNWKATCKNLGIEFDKTMDILLAGKAMSWSTGDTSGVSYDVRMRKIDESFTPKNRIIMCRAQSVDKSASQVDMVEAAHQKLGRAYQRAHRLGTRRPRRDRMHPIGSTLIVLLSGFLLGFGSASLIRSRSK